MRRILPLLAVLTLMAAGAGGSARAALPADQSPATVQVLPGDVPLIQDEPADGVLPVHFRIAADPFPADAQGPLPSRAGLDALRMSGSAQFSAAQLRAVIEQVGRPFVVIDLRQESHGFVDGTAVSWYAFHDQVNVARSLLEVQQDERRRVDGLLGTGSVTALVVTGKGASGEITEGRPVMLPATTAQTERELAESLGAGYLRIPATDFLPPRPENVDRFIEFARGLPPETWLHFHCHGGDGRTTTFMAIWDMMHNAGTVTVDDIVRRQALIGPEDLFKQLTPDNWKYPFARERAAFIRAFYQYALANAGSGFIVPWSVWSATHPPPAGS